MKKNIIKLQSVFIPPNGIHLIVNVKINSKTARLVLDTGASQTVLDMNRMMRFTTQKKFEKSDGHSSGIGSSSMESHIFISEKLEIGDFTIVKKELVLLDMIHVNNSYALINKKPVDGVLGGDILKKYKAVINYATKELHLFKKPVKKK
ncbi:MAG: aspartyl protease family protein [Bacteroidota bacterium]